MCKYGEKKNKKKPLRQGQSQEAQFCGKHYFLQRVPKDALEMAQLVLTVVEALSQKGIRMLGVKSASVLRGGDSTNPWNLAQR